MRFTYDGPGNFTARVSLLVNATAHYNGCFLVHVWGTGNRGSLQITPTNATGVVPFAATAMFRTSIV